MRILLASEGFPEIPLANTLTAFKILIRFDLCDTCQGKRYERKDMHRTLSLETWCFAKVIMSSKCRERKTQLTAEKKNPSKQ